MKMQITIDIKNDDGTIGAEATVIEVEVPDFEAFTGPEKFGEVFDAYERKVLEARNEALAVATEKYLSELAKKKRPVKLPEAQGKLLQAATFSELFPK